MYHIYNKKQQTTIITFNINISVWILCKMEINYQFEKGIKRSNLKEYREVCGFHGFNKSLISHKLK